VNRWPIIIRPLTRTHRTTFCAKPIGSATEAAQFQLLVLVFLSKPLGGMTQMMRTMISGAIGEPPRKNAWFKHRALAG